jgi:DMSO/TMAO reductase YedYZ molybdopterin-dependent catalytic subunit
VAGRSTNLALLLLLPAAGLSGAATFLVGSGVVGLVVTVHGIIGLMVLVLIPWKSKIIRRGLRRRRSGHLMSIVLAGTVLVAVATGLAHTSGTLISAAGLTALQVHVAASLAAFIPLIMHVRQRTVRFRPGDVSRRTLLRTGMLVAAASAGYVALEGLAAALSLPGASRRATGSYERSSGSPDAMPTTSWLLDEPPDIDPASWRLVVRSGGTRRNWSVEEIRAMGDQASVILDCTGGWWSRQLWSGAKVSRLLPAGTGGSVAVTSATGYRRTLPLSDELLLAVDVGGQPLSVGHGAPMRLVVPGRRGYHWVKWVSSIEHESSPWWAESPLPLQ